MPQVYSVSLYSEDRVAGLRNDARFDVQWEKYIPGALRSKKFVMRTEVYVWY